MEQRVQFSQIVQNLPLEITLKFGQIGIVVGVKPLKNQTNSYMVEFYDNVRIWLLTNELTPISGFSLNEQTVFEL